MADALFTVRLNQKTGIFEARYNGVTYPVEAALVRPLYKVTKLSAIQDLGRPETFIIFPYEQMQASSLIAEETLRLRFPLAYAYLSAVKERLLARDKGKTHNYPAWYAYGRTQGFHELGYQKIALIPVMIGGKSLPMILDTTQVTDLYGSPLFLSGFAVRSSVAEPTTFLSSAFRDYVRENGTPKPGAEESYYAISSKHVNAFVHSHHSADAP